MRTLIRFMTASGLALALAACGGGGEEAPDANATGDFSPVLAEVGDQPITRAYFDYYYENLSPMDKARYTGENWEQRFLDYLIEQELVAQAAEEERLDLVRENEWRLRIARQQTLHGAYKDKHFGQNIVVPEDEVTAYYEGSTDDFRTRGRMRADHIQCASKEKIDQAWKMLQKGTHWGEVVAEFSEDEATINDGGSLGWFNPDGYVIGMGFNPEFTEAAFALDAHTTAPPMKIGDNWHIIRTAAKVPGDVQPLEEVRDRIERRLRPGIAEEQFDKDLRRLRQEKGVRYFGEFANEERRSADALYKVAAQTRDPHAKLEYYGRVVDLYPEHELADESLFMKGFVHSEEFGDVGMAARCFRRLQREYPESEYAEQAAWMLEHLGRSVPELRGDQLPRTAEEADQRIRDAGN